MPAMICADCGHAGRTATRTPGSILIEVVLWCCLIVPGLVYSLWRHSRRHEVCASCGSASIIPQDSPRGAQLVAQYQQAAPADAIRPPSSAAVGTGRALGRALGRLASRR